MSSVDYASLPAIDCPACGSARHRFLIRRFDGGPLVRCEECRHVFLNPPLPADLLARVYADYHATDDDAAQMELTRFWFADPRGPYQAAIAALPATLPGGLRGAKVLEVGCGPGHFLASCRVAGAEVTGVDPSVRAVNLASLHFGVRVVPSTLDAAIEQGALPAQAFDCVFAFEVIEHVEKPVAFLRKVRDLLRPGGLAILSTPNFRLLESMGEAAPPINRWPEHLHFFDCETLSAGCARAGLRVESIRTVNRLSRGVRTKQKLARHPAVRALWRRLRTSRAVSRCKDWLFEKIDERDAPSEQGDQNGTAVLCFARRAS